MLWPSRTRTSYRSLSRLAATARVAACYLARGVPHWQGAAHVFSQAFNPVHIIARLCRRGGAIYDLTPAGSSGFAANTVFHTSGRDAVPRMQAITAPVGAYLRWSGLLINMPK